MIVTTTAGRLRIEGCYTDAVQAYADAHARGLLLVVVSGAVWTCKSSVARRLRSAGYDVIGLE